MSELHQEPLNLEAHFVFIAYTPDHLSVPSVRPSPKVTPLPLSQTVSVAPPHYPPRLSHRVLCRGEGKSTRDLLLLPCQWDQGFGARFPPGVSIHGQRFCLVPLLPFCAFIHIYSGFIHRWFICIVHFPL